jgi:SAM-dependent methyltransferase
MPHATVTDYDSVADAYAAGVDARPWNAHYERPAMLAALPPVEGRDVLDAGCGPGFYADWLATRGARVTAVDVSERMAAIARARLGDRARVHACDMADLDAIVAPASLDLVVSSLAVHYVHDLVPLFDAWARVLRPGGRVVLSTHHPFYDLKRVRRGGYTRTEIVQDSWGWLGLVRYYHRPLAALLGPLAAAGLLVDRIDEPAPTEALRAMDPEGYAKLARMPGFLIVRAVRPDRAVRADATRASENSAGP